MSDAAGGEIGLRSLVRGALGLLPRAPQLVDALRLGLRSSRTETTSIGSLLEDRAREYPNRCALRFDDRQWTWAELNAEANRFAAGFRARGVARGDVVAIMSENCPELLMAVAGLVKLGAVGALINTLQRGAGLRHSLTVASVRHATADAHHVAVLESAAEPSVWPLSEIATGDGRWNPASTGVVRAGDPAYYIYTSGTTGFPKASVCTHLRFVKGGAAIGHALMGLREDDVLYVPLPFFHTLALTMA